MLILNYIFSKLNIHLCITDYNKLRIYWVLKDVAFMYSSKNYT